ncbi:MAG: hypothetical protein SNJ60_07255 [Pseudanabaenaceae cyanobacterium]
MDKPCEHCQNLCAVRYRMQATAGGPWVLVCPDGWAVWQRDNPHCSTWKARRR